ncbi:carbon-nitrogen hydrolase family protein [Thermosipho ferrireducens]|uniref:Carbon-nitrogen hydrolase family protein n=1 Tax=Thermosipho ferrireducens TaxID=2571116 RepID=A0ABX7S9P7_9BACT|nr:carbon-nitrogen hydrolase family protein [Thermosipho ferrireducens]QTA38590.1 carbon-nitrogen hydrolase family protein [Thermosipho ferrireducens]
MLITSAQFEPVPGKFKENFEKHIEFIEKAGSIGADIILFPELSLSGYTYNPEILENSIDFFKKIKEDLLKLSRKYNIAIIGGIPRKIQGKLRNSVFVFRKKKEILFYDKTHLFRKEKEVFESGEHFLLFRFSGVNFGIFICYEVGFPEIARILALNGAEVFLVPFAFGKERAHIYDIATRSRALENGAFLVTSSTAGKGIMDYIGKSRLINPRGDIVVEAVQKEELIASEIDVQQLHHYRFIESGDSHAYFLNRREELYQTTKVMKKGKLL